MSLIKLDNFVKNQLADTCVGKALSNELIRQNNDLELIASENYPSAKVRLAMASIATAKYAEGYPKKRYYGGCQYIDQIEQAAIDKACELFKCQYANVQPHSGSQANAAAYKALERYLKLNRKMRILSLALDKGAHLTHGSPVSFSSEQYEFDFFELGQDGRLDFSLIEEKIISFKPDVLLTGYSAYPYAVDFSKFRELANKYNILLMVDMAHIAGLVACGEHQSPVPYADIVTSTTHKTLRGPRGGFILTNNEEIIKYVNAAVFPYSQGGPLEHVIAAKAICFEEAMQPSFKEYIKAVKANTLMFAKTLRSIGVKCTLSENHLLLVDVKQSFDMTGAEAQKILERYDIITNKNLLPNDTEKPSRTSGLRIGFAALTTRGCTKESARKLAHIINFILGRGSKQKSERVIKKYISDIRKTLIKIESI